MAGPARTPASPLRTLAAGAAAVAGLALAIALAVGAGQYAGFALDAERHDKVLDRPSPFLPEVRAREAAELGGYRWVDRKAGVIGQPLERALERTLEERGAP